MKDGQRAPDTSRAASGNQPPGRNRRLEQHGTGELRFAFTALDERDRHFGDAGSPARRHEEHLDQERIAVGDDPIERQCGERLAAPAAVTARAVACTRAGSRANVEVGETAEQRAAAAASSRWPARHVAGADHDVGARGRRDDRADTRDRARDRRPSDR